MADEPENHTLRLLREMREENKRMHAETREQVATALAGMRAEFATALAETRAENLRMHVETKEQLATVIETVLLTSKAVNAVREDVADLKRGHKIIEAELRALRGRVERIEDKLDGVRA